MSHEVFKVNDVEYQAEGGIDSEIVKDGNYVTNIYKGATKLQEVVYEDYSSIAEEAPTDTYHILIDEFDGKLIITDGGIDYYTKYRD